MNLLILILAVYSIWPTTALSETVETPIAVENEGKAIAECMEHYGGLTEESAERLQRFKHWSDTYEEIPCFTSCYLNKTSDVYQEQFGFNQENIIKQFGQPVYDACKKRLTFASGGQNACQLVYSGFHCLVSLENDPFVLIEAMETLDSEAKTAMKECLRQYDQYEWARLAEYKNFPVREPIPCFTKCFIEKMQLFNVRTRQWNFNGLITKLGLPTKAESAQNCKSLSRRRARNSCAWVYQEFTCLKLSGGN